jgi:hypothetical protein
MDGRFLISFDFKAKYFRNILFGSLRHRKIERVR